MTSGEIFLILISGLGVLHGVFLAVFLWVYNKGHRPSNRILSILLATLSFRVGKSVFLEFAEHLDIQFIFLGLATLLAIGPLFYLFVLSVINEDRRWKGKYALHFIPTALGLLFGFLIREDWMESLPKAFFVTLFITYYLHYFTYLLISYRQISKAKRERPDGNSYSLLQWLFFALLAIWFAYVLNLFDDLIPYVVGPVLYTLVAYSVSFVVIRKGYIPAIHRTKYKTTPVSEEQIDRIYSEVLKVVKEEQLFKNSNLTLASLSKKLRVTSQTLSLVINQRSHTNFNGFINRYRIEEAVKIFRKAGYEHHTIASVAFEVGFNSLSSFNTAFKKQTGSTPLDFRKRLA